MWLEVHEFEGRGGTVASPLCVGYFVSSIVREHSERCNECIHSVFIIAFVVLMHVNSVFLGGTLKVYPFNLGSTFEKGAHFTLVICYFTWPACLHVYL